MSNFPTTRPRRLRNSPTLRRMVQETTLSADDLMYPLFIQHGENVHDEIASMPGQFRLSVDQLEREVGELTALGIPATSFGRRSPLYQVMSTFSEVYLVPLNE